VAVVAYVLIARSSGSILRAGLMVVLHGAARLAGRRTARQGRSWSRRWR
jgi:hypothetical protein